MKFLPFLCSFMLLFYTCLPFLSFYDAFFINFSISAGVNFAWFSIVDKYSACKILKYLHVIIRSVRYESEIRKIYLRFISIAQHVLYNQQQYLFIGWKRRRQTGECLSVITSTMYLYITIRMNTSATKKISVKTSTDERKFKNTTKNALNRIDADTVDR